jgi:hypothetical protein
MAAKAQPAKPTLAATSSMLTLAIIKTVQNQSKQFKNSGQNNETYKFGAESSAFSFAENR